VKHSEHDHHWPRRGLWWSTLVLERWVWSWARFVANVHSQIRTAGEPIKDAGYRPHAVCVVQLHLALVGNTGKGARVASCRGSTLRTTTRITTKFERDVMSTATSAAPLVSAGLDINA
jgi:hypothetical protein